MKPRTVEFNLKHPRERNPVRIVNDAAISTRGLHGGRLLPLLLLDLGERPDIREFIRAHEVLGPGDVTVQWGQVEEPGHEGKAALFLKCVRPMELFIIVEFDIARQGILVEQMLTGHGCYIAEAESEDDRFIKNPERPKVIVEIPDTGYRPIWDEIFFKHVSQDLRNHGMSRSESRQAARSIIVEMRKLTSLKMRDILNDVQPEQL